MMVSIYASLLFVTAFCGFLMGTICLVRLENRPLVLLRHVPPEEVDLLYPRNDIVLC